MLGLLIDSGANVAAMIDDVLINRSGAEAAKRDAANLAELLKHSVALLQFKASEKGQHIQLIDDGPVTVQMDSDQVWRVINNLLVNAIKFSKEQTTITVTTQKLERTVRVSIADQGIGIPDDFRDLIFDAFTTAQRTGTSGEETFGLGLYISKQIIEAHGGRIGIEHSSAEGSTFYFTLPLG
jgi:signal transduction histidine kinase